MNWMQRQLYRLIEPYLRSFVTGAAVVDRADVFMGKDVAAARQWGRRQVRIQWSEPASPGPGVHSAERGS